MPSPRGKLNTDDYKSWGASAATVGGTFVGVAVLGNAVATLLIAWLVTWWPEAAEPENAAAINVVVQSLIYGLSLLVGIGADLLRRWLFGPSLKSNRRET